MGLANGLRRGVRGLETLARMQAGRSMLPPRECLMKLQFEGRDAPAAYIAKSEVLAVYAKARTTGGVLDLGFSCSVVVPVL